MFDKIFCLCVLNAELTLDYALNYYQMILNQHN